MSDDGDDDFMMESDPEQYDFQYEDDDMEETTAEAEVENTYYNGKQMKQEDPQAAIEAFLSIPGLEEEKSEWSFKGIKQALKLEFKSKMYDDSVEHYATLLEYVKNGVVNRNTAEKSINSILDFISLSNDPNDMACMETFYSMTLEAFQGPANERTWLRTNVKLARLLLDRQQYDRLAKNVKQLRQFCTKDDGTDDPSKVTYLLEVYAIEIQMLSETKNNKQLKAIYKRALQVKSAVPHPKIMGIIRECGGKMHMSEENWKEAQTDFFEAFRSYDEAGSPQRIQVLKYLVLSYMLLKSEINPFDTQETKPFKNDPDVVAMTDLVDAYQRNDVQAYETVLQKNRRKILEDAFIREHIDEVTRNVRMGALVKLIAPYSRFTVEWVGKQLQITPEEVQEIVGFLILDGKLNGKMNEDAGTVEVTSGTEDAGTRGMWEWSLAIGSLYDALLRNGAGFKVPETGKLGPASMFAGGRLDMDPSFSIGYGGKKGKRGLPKIFGGGGGR